MLYIYININFVLYYKYTKIKFFYFFCILIICFYNEIDLINKLGLQLYTYTLYTMTLYFNVQNIFDCIYFFFFRCYYVYIIINT